MNHLDLPAFRLRASGILWAILSASLSAVLASCASSPGESNDAEGLKEIFADPPREYTTAPLWVWNDLLTDEQIQDTLRALAGQGVRQAFVHPRPGLMTPYLSDEWFRLWKVALAEAKKLDMNLWIYDENSYPSGFAGGHVPEAMPESRGRGLAFSDVATPPAWTDVTLGVYRIDGSRSENLSVKVKAKDVLPEGPYVVATVIRAGNSPWHGGRSYVDLLYPGVTEKFLELTMEAYRRSIGDEFGEHVPGVFTDEPQLVPAGGLPWTERLPESFEKRWGYSLLDHLPSLTRPVGDWKRVRHDYYQLLLEQFIERWAKPYFDYCARRNLEFTGHYWEHEWPRCVLVPDNMAMSAWSQRPGIDILMNRYDEGTHAQFGNVRAVREISSVANQLGRRRTLCEAYGAGGWDLRLEDMKRIADWLYVLGINTLDEHLSYVTIRGARKKDHPQSFSYHEPWWDAYHIRATYSARLSAALSRGEQRNPFLVLEPTTTAWLYQGDDTAKARLEALGNQFQSLLLSLERDQVEYDLGCEEILQDQGIVLGMELRVGRRGYRAVVLPPLTESLNPRTVALLGAFLREGGTVLCCGDPPALIEGRPSMQCQEIAKSPRWQMVRPDDVPEILAQMVTDGFAIRRADGDAGILFHHRRQLSDGELVFLANTSNAEPSVGKVVSRKRGAESWDLETGRVFPCHFVSTESGIELPFRLEPCGSLLVFLSNEPCETVPAMSVTSKVIAPSGTTQVRRLEPNVLVLDYVEVTAGGETRKDVHVYQAAQFAFQKNGLERNPWDSAVQFRDEFISRRFSPESGFRATYRFVIEEKVPESLFAVVERPDLYRIALNGTPLVAPEGPWWLDRSFGKIDVRSAAKVGENTLELAASPFTVFHEIESTYILGDFGVKPAAAGFAIVPPAELTAGSWREQLHPLYGSGVAYAETFEVPAAASAASGSRYRVSLPDWHGSVARVTVNGNSAGWIEAPPYRLDVTEWIRPGSNVVEVVVYGSLRNTLGPHHAGLVVGQAWPEMFHQAPSPGPPPGAQYSTIDYGIMKPFVLLQESESPSMESSPSTSPAAPRESKIVAQARQLVQEYEARIVPLEIALNLAWWNANTSGKDADFLAKEEAQNRLDEALADAERFSRLKDVRKVLQEPGQKVDPIVSRQIEVLYLQALEKQVDPELLRKISAKANAVEKAFNLYRAEVDGKELTDSEVRKVLKEEKRDLSARKAVWEASKGVGRIVEADLKELVSLRNEAARKLGYKNFHAMQLALNEQSQTQVLHLFDELDSLTRGPFHLVKAEIDSSLAAGYGIQVSELRPWHYQDPFFQEAPAIYATDLDAAYAGQDILDLCRRFYEGIGLNVDDVLARSDLHERPGKSPHAFSTDIDRAGDVRVLANIVPNEYWMGTMLHELGHAVYSSKNIPTALPYALRTDAHILATEGIAILFEKFSKNASFLKELGVAVSDPEGFSDTGRKMQRDRILIFAAWCQVMLRFEVAMYENPSQDLNRLWWDLVERYQLVRRPDGRDAPDYGAKIHVVSAPAYYHNYLMGDLFAAQLHDAISRDVLKTKPEGAIYNGRKEVGEFLKQKVFTVGRLLNWNALARHATGEDLNARAFAAAFQSP